MGHLEDAIAHQEKMATLTRRVPKVGDIVHYRPWASDATHAAIVVFVATDVRCKSDDPVIDGMPLVNLHLMLAWGETKFVQGAVYARTLQPARWSWPE